MSAPESCRFFLGAWPAWRRIPRATVPSADFDHDNNDHVKMMSLEACEKMLSAFKTPNNISSIDKLRKAEG